MRHRVLQAALALAVSGCIAPPGPMERLGNAAYELNTATRFGRMDIALGHVAADAQAGFSGRHQRWGRDLRVVDVDLLGMQAFGEGVAEVQLSVSWHRLDETILRQTNIAQRWLRGGAIGDWQLAEEARTSGDHGLFAEPKPALGPKPAQALNVGGDVDLPD